jgi:hypothetical protein
VQSLQSLRRQENPLEPLQSLQPLCRREPVQPVQSLRGEEPLQPLRNELARFGSISFAEVLARPLPSDPSLSLGRQRRAFFFHSPVALRFAQSRSNSHCGTSAAAMLNSLHERQEV